MRLNCPKEDPLTVTMTDCTVSPRKGFEDIPFVTGEFLQEVRLDRVQISGFQNPRIINVTDT